MSQIPTSVCKHCGLPIAIRYSWGRPIWAHEKEGMFVTQCIVNAEPEDDA